MSFLREAYHEIGNTGEWGIHHDYSDMTAKQGQRVMFYEWRKKAKRFIKMSFKRVTKKKTHDKVKEILWTIFPTLILIAIAIPSILLLYSMDSLVLTGEPVYTFKVIGHQWFWSYEYFGITNYVAYCVEQSLANGVVESIQGKEVVPRLVNYSSYMLDEQAVYEIQGGLRLLEVDNPLFVPTLLCLRFLITSVDVLHSWAVPSLGIKVDAVPGRINQVYTLVKRESKFYGQCSEICGVNHGFMPVKVVAYDEPEEEHAVMFYQIEKALKDYNERRVNPPVPEEVPFSWWGFFHYLLFEVNWWPWHVIWVMYCGGDETEWPNR